MSAGYLNSAPLLDPVDYIQLTDSAERPPTPSVANGGPLSERIHSGNPDSPRHGMRQPVSTAQRFIAVDRSMLESLIRAHRFAEEASTEPTAKYGARLLDPRSVEASTLRTLIENVRLPSNKRKREQAQKRLAR